MMRHTFCFYIILFVCLLPIILLRDYTPANELRYLSIADEAIRDGHLFAFTHHGEAYADKPPLFIWLMMLLRLCPWRIQHLLGALCSVVPAFVTIETTGRIMQMKGKDLLMLRLIMLSTGLFLASMLTLRMDMLMCMFIMLAIQQFAQQYRTAGSHERLWLPFFMFLAVFTKGPFGILIPVAVILVFLIVRGKVSTFFCYLGWRSWLLLTVLFGGWFIAAGLEGGSSYLTDLLFHQTLGRAFHSFHHSKPVYYYLYMIWALLLPWAFAMVYALCYYLRAKRQTSDRLRLMVIGCIVTFVLLSLVSAKLSVYLLPFVPFVAALTVRWMTDSQTTWPLAIGYALFSLFFSILYIGSNLVPSYFPIQHPIVILTIVVISVGAVAALIVLRLKHKTASVEWMAGGLMLATCLTGFVFPDINQYIGYSQLCSEAKTRQAETGAHQMVSYGIKHAADMDVYLGEVPLILSSPNALASIHQAIVMMPVQAKGSQQLKHCKHVGNNVIGYKP